MGLWNFVKGHDDFLSEIRNNSDSNIVVFKHPNEDFNTKSHLFLNESEVALFVNTKTDGSSETFLLKKGGTLDTLNLPFLRSINQIFTGGQSVFHCAVYFVRTNTFASIGWGTESPIGPVEDYNHYTFNLKANGTYDLKIKDAQLLINELYGQSGISSVTKDEIAMILNPKISRFIGDLLCRLFEFPELHPSITRIQNLIRKDAYSAFNQVMDELCGEKWGISFDNFTLNLIVDGLDEIMAKRNEAVLQTEIIDYQAESYKTINLYEILKTAAANPGNMASSMMGMGAGASMGVALGNTIGSTIMTSGIGGTQIGEQPTGNQSTEKRNWGGVPEYEKKRMERQRRLQELNEDFKSNLIDKENYDRIMKEITDEYYK